MASERFYSGTPTLLFISNGGSDGQISVLSTVNIKVKQKALVKANSLNSLTVEIKQVLNETDIIVGPPSSKMRGVGSTIDLTSYTTASQASIYIEPQDRPAIYINDWSRAVYEEEPTVAIRTFPVDHLGRRYSVDNPFPVQLSDGSINIGTVSAQLETFLTHKDNDPDLGDVHSSIRIGDGTDELAINSDGSLNVVLQTTGGELLRSEYNEVNSVANGSDTDIVTITAGIGVNTFLSKIDYSGDNVAKYSVDLNGTIIDKQRTYFGGNLNGIFNFANGSKGLKLQPGDVVTLKVIHSRPSAGDFNGRIQVVES